MKTIEHMKEKCPLLEPIEAHIAEEVKTKMQELANNQATLRRLLVQQVCAPKAKDEMESVAVFQIGMKLRSADESCDLEDSEFRLVRDRVKENKLEWGGHIQGWVANKLDEADLKSREKAKA